MNENELAVRGRLREMDLNLLVVLDALLTHGGVSATARELGRTQSAVSHALTRLRDQLGDPLLVRQGRAMLPTSRALDLWPLLRTQLLALDRLTRAPETFEPASASRRFSVRSSDYLQLVLLPSLIAALSQRAPGISLQVRLADGPAADAVGAGGFDLAWVPFHSKPDPAVLVEPLFRDRFVGLACVGHPVLTGRCTLRRFASHGHVVVTPTGDLSPGPVEAALSKGGHERCVALITSGYLAAAAVVVQSDLLLVVPERVARAVADSSATGIFKLPFRMPEFWLHQVWHRRMAEDPAHRFVRELVGESASALPRLGGGVR